MTRSSFADMRRLSKPRGAKVVFAVQDSLKDLMKGLSPTIEIVGLDTPVSGANYHCLLMSLPFLFGTSLETIPDKVPYLCAEKEQVERWKLRVGDHGFRIGLCWQGSNSAAALGKSFPSLRFARSRKSPMCAWSACRNSTGSNNSAACRRG